MLCLQHARNTHKPGFRNPGCLQHKKQGKRSKCFANDHNRRFSETFKFSQYIAYSSDREKVFLIKVLMNEQLLLIVNAISSM